MLWPVIKPSQSALYWLDEVHKGFYRLMFAGNIFDNCFPSTFTDVLNLSGETKQRFQNVFNAYQILTQALKQEFAALFTNQVQCLLFLGNVTSLVITPK